MRPTESKTRAQGLKGSPRGPQIGNNDKRENERTPKAEELKNIKKWKLHNVALARFTSAGIKITSHPEEKTRQLIKKRK